ncbi:helix-turn-helix domain-containing protein [Aestuariibacter sp. AA17]|uniref:Helix-turn-helix domain-containing protein n=1 Tax=Fluctibacter corallii TaxID=2984329 RepID=A0ABT3AAL3_9ALTE|nr:AlkA N-terminal domain-containing protein [Aestuariibacter sp. AA17]MCV2885700.1 helix-turn-helix domain-containing protein [Aestuariibacter sp. AA17]
MNMVLSQQAYQSARQARDYRFDGTFFVAVKTTGIFCRPICPAPAPKEDNVTYYDYAHQAMQAGYRPCLRCRPDSAPSSFAWKGVDTTVERAIKLIRQHPQDTLAHLVERLGITDRYLRRLFAEKLGVSPKQFQLYEKLLFAKQLIQQSTMTIEDVAQASGFSSSRRLQENMKKQMGLTPIALRNGKSVSHHTISLSLSFRPPYHWPQVRAFLAMRAIPDMEWVTDESYGRTIVIEACYGQFTATYHEAKSCFEVSVELSDPAYLKQVIFHIRRILDLDADPAVISHALHSTGLTESHCTQGIRLPGVFDTFEAGCRAVLGQQVSVKAAINLVTKLVENVGVKRDDKRWFPTPEIVAESDLTFLKMPDSRRQALKRLAQFIADKPDADPVQWLALKGIGPWTAAYAEMRGQSQPDIWLNTDLVIKKQLAQYALDADLAAPWRSYLTFQLWSLAS